jgi:hypothetical protein
MVPLTELLLACSLHADQRLLEAIVDVYSAGNPSTVVDVGISALEDQDQPLALLDGARSQRSARADVFRLLAQGGDPLFGLLPVRRGWAQEFGKSVDDLFEPCANVAVASAKISEFDYACRSHGPRPTSLRRRSCTLRGYAGSVALPALPRAVLVALGSASCCENSASPPAAVFAPAPDFGLFFRAASSANGSVLAEPGVR